MKTLSASGAATFKSNLLPYILGEDGGSIVLFRHTEVALQAMGAARPRGTQSIITLVPILLDIVHWLVDVLSQRPTKTAQCPATSKQGDPCGEIYSETKAIISRELAGD